MTPPLRLGPGGDYRRDVWRIGGASVWDWLAAAALLAIFWWVLA